MPSESSVLRCGNCGANLSPVPGQNVVQCSYCSQATYLTQTVVNAPQQELAAAAAPGGTRGLHEQLLAGPGSTPQKARGTRLTTRDMTREQLIPVERAIWPVRASASTTYGGSWSPSAMVGPPKVFPRYGDIGGAWAPSSSSSRVEWVELEYNTEFPVTGLRVYETLKSGNVYAVVDHTSGDELLFAAAVDPRSESCALEVTFDSARVIRRLRVYLTNTNGYTEIDTVALLARDPLPLDARPHVPPPTKELSVSGAMWVFFGVLAVLIAGVIYAVKQDSSDSTALMSAPTSALQGATILIGNEPLEAIAARNPRWAISVVDVSSEYSGDGNAAVQALGAPNVYPRAGDIPQAWAPLSADAGIQHITLHFGEARPTSAVFWLETYNPGAVVRIDDLTDPAQPVTLFTGVSPSRGRSGAMAVEIRLPQPRSMHTVRLYLDTAAIVGWNEIDAVALMP